MFKDLYNIIKILFRGIGQVIFQNNALSGAIFLIGICFNSLTMGIFALAGSAIGTLAAYLLKYDGKDIRDGLYGFNGTLVGIAVPCFLPINIISVLIMVIGAGLSTWVAHIIGKQKLLPGMTAPFVLVTWVILLLAAIVPELQIGEKVADIGESTFNPLRAFSLGFGQIMLQGNTIITGLMFILAIGVNAPEMALRASLACVLSLPLAWLPFMDMELVNNGMFGYNAILAFIAVTDIVAMTSLRYLKAFAALLLSFIFQYAGLHFGITTLTAPFVLAVWVVVLFDRAI